MRDLLIQVQEGRSGAESSLLAALESGSIRVQAERQGATDWLLGGGVVRTCMVPAGKKANKQPEPETFWLVDRYDDRVPVILDSQDPISQRRSAIFLRLAAGEQPKSLSTQMGLSEHTVNEYIKDGKRQLNARSITEAVVKLIRMGQIRIEPGTANEKEPTSSK